MRKNEKIMTIEETTKFINNQTLCLDGEIWRPHPVYNTYSASNFGRIKYHNSVHTEKIKIQSIDKQVDRYGFCIHTTHRQKRFKSARFICECFYGLNDGLVVDHKNTISYDNRLENLRFCSPTDNNNNEITNTKRKAKNRVKYTEEIKQHQNIDEENEMWKPHPNIDVEVSNMGRVRWTTSKTPGRPYVTSGTYDGPEKRFLKIKYGKRAFLVHRLVADTFMANPNNHKYIRHIDGNTLNNRVDNLEWASLTDIMIYNKAKHKNTYRIASVDNNGNIIKRYESLGEASKEGYNKDCVRDCINGKQHTHKGLVWIKVSE